MLEHIHNAEDWVSFGFMIFLISGAICILLLAIGAFIRKVFHGDDYIN